MLPLENAPVDTSLVAEPPAHSPLGKSGLHRRQTTMAAVVNSLHADLRGALARRVDYDPLVAACLESRLYEIAEALAFKMIELVEGEEGAPHPHGTSSPGRARPSLPAPDVRRLEWDAATEIATVLVAAEQLSGDFLELIPREDHRLGVLIGDVMGKGNRAALVSAALSNRLLQAAAKSSASPAELVAAADRAMSQRLIELDRFVTLCCARLDTMHRLFEFVNCGHMPIIHYVRQSDSCTRLWGDNMPLGFQAAEVPVQSAVPFGPGDVFVLYSDGLTEELDARGKLFGMARLEDLILEHSHASADRMAQVIQQAVIAHCDGQKLRDDLTCIVIKIKDDDQGADRPWRAHHRVSTDLANLNVLRRFVREIGRDLESPPLDGEQLEALELAVNEAACNIMVHAYGGQVDGWIRIAAEVHPERVVLTLTHAGAPFDPESVPPPIIDEPREHGMGLFLIACATDNVTYSTHDDGVNRIVLEKYRTIAIPRASNPCHREGARQQQCDHTSKQSAT